MTDIRRTAELEFRARFVEGLVYTLHDVVADDAGPHLLLTQVTEGRSRTVDGFVTVGAVTTVLQGYGVAGMDGEAAVMFLELHNGKPVLYVWADINNEEPTHRIDLSGAALEKRTPALCT